MKMKKIIFEVSDDMLGRMDKAASREGFPTRSEFLRFLIVTYLKANPNKERSEAQNGDAVNQSVKDEFANVDCEFGIPDEVIEKLKKKVGIIT